MLMSTALPGCGVSPSGKTRSTAMTTPPGSRDFVAPSQNRECAFVVPVVQHIGEQHHVATRDRFEEVAADKAGTVGRRLLTRASRSRPSPSRADRRRPGEMRHASRGSRRASLPIPRRHQRCDGDRRGRVAANVWVSGACGCGANVCVKRGASVGVLGERSPEGPPCIRS